MKKRIERQLFQALAEGELSVWRLLDRQDASIKEFHHLLRELEKKRFLKLEQGRVRLTPAGKRHARELSTAPAEYRCKVCQGRGYVQADGELRERFQSIATKRPPSNPMYDQGYMAPDDVLLRIAFMHERGDLGGAEIIVLGDDDLLSIACALTGLPKRVLALDVDKSIVDFINRVSREEGLEVAAELYDVREPLDAELEHSFDVFVTDPVETLDGISLFLSRGASSLKGTGSSGYFGLTTLEASRVKWQGIERRLINMGFVITDIRRAYSVYPVEKGNFFEHEEMLKAVKMLGARSDHNWFTSAFWRVEAVEEPKPLFTGKLKIGKEFYVDDETWATAEPLENPY